MHCFPHVNTASGVAPLTSCQHWVSRCRTEMSHGHDNTHKHCCCRVTGLGHRNGITGEESWGLHFYIDTVFCVEYTMLVCKRLLGPLLNKTVSGKLWTRVPRNRCLKAQCRCQFRSPTGDITLPAIGMQLWPLMVEAARGANVPNNNTAMIHASVTP